MNTVIQPVSLKMVFMPINIINVHTKITLFTFIYFLCFHIYSTVFMYREIHEKGSGDVVSAVCVQRDR